MPAIGKKIVPVTQMVRFARIMGMKDAQNFHFLLPFKYRLRLQVIADQDGYSVSWLLRCILKSYRAQFRETPNVINRERFQCPHVRFNLVFYGDKEIYFQWARSFGQELGPVVRAIVAYYLDVGFPVDFGDLELVKKEKEPDSGNCRKALTFSRYASAYRIKGDTYQPDDYWPVNHENNLNNMHLGLKRKKKCQVAEAIKWFKRRYPKLKYHIAT